MSVSTGKTVSHTKIDSHMTDYERIFHPKKLAILGVSGEDGSMSFGTNLFRSITTIGFQGEIFPVNPKGGTIDGLNIFKRVEDIPGIVDFAVIAVAARYVQKVLEECLNKGVAGVEILSSGFSELGTEEGEELEQQIKNIATKGIRVIGPNCFGIYCPKSGLTLMPGPDLSRQSGPVGFLSQSGGIAIDFAHMGKWMGILFSKVISFGNGADLRETELINYLANDEETLVIIMYIEGVENGDAFFREIKAAARKKPVIVYKGGLSVAGQRTVASHTASMGGNRVIWESILKQVNAIQVYNTEELAQTSLAFSLLPQRSFHAISIIGGGGALGVAACDTAENFGIEVPPFSTSLRERIEEFLPKPGSSAINPIDVANPHVSVHALKEILLHAAEDKRIELQILVSLLYHYKPLAQAMKMPMNDVTPYRQLAEAVREVVDKTGKPVVMALPNPKKGLADLDIIELIIRARQEFLDRGIPVYDELHDAIRAIAHVNAYYTKRKIKSVCEDT
jgi:acyl-CoA synthetase (NDP forming)